MNLFRRAQDPRVPAELLVHGEVLHVNFASHDEYLEFVLLVHDDSPDVYPLETQSGRDAWLRPRDVQVVVASPSRSRSQSTG